MKFFTKNWRRYSAIAALALGLLVVDGQSQTLKNQSTGRIVNNGSIKFTCEAGQFQNAADPTVATTLVNNGTIEFEENASATGKLQFTDLTGAAAGNSFGLAPTSRVPGTVIFNGGGAQVIQSDLYLTNLDLGGSGNKTYDGDIYVAGAYTVTTGTPVYANAGGSGGGMTFYYDGATDQTIYATAGGHTYYNLGFLDAGVKTLAGATLATTTNDATIGGTPSTRASGNVIIDGQLTVNHSLLQEAGAGNLIIDNITDANTGTVLLAGTNAGTGNSLLEATTNIGNGGVLRTTGDGVLTVATGANLNVNAGTFNLNAGNADIDGTLAAAATAGVIDVDQSRTLTISGTFTNAGDGTNLLFADETVAGDGLASTVIYDGGAAQAVVTTIASNPYANLQVINAGAKVPGGNIYVANDWTLGDADFAMGANTLFMTDNAATATYNTDHEVTGRMNRTMGVGGPLTFNNSSTTVAVTANTASLTDLTLNVQPGGYSTDATYSAHYDGTTDVDRLITYDYSQTAADWVAIFEFGYKKAEEPAYAPNPAGGNYDHTSLRFRELTAADVSEKVATGSATGDDYAAAVFASRSLPGIQPGTATLAQIDDPAPLFLRGGPTTFISITDGRWSNPNTWDEGAEPGPGDFTIIATGTQVHAGGIGSGGRDPFAGDETYPDELTAGCTVQTGAALIFGNNINQNFALSTGASMTIESGADADPNQATFATFLSSTPASYTGRGLFIYEGTNPTVLKTPLFDNAGLFYNDGELQVCD